MAPNVFQASIDNKIDLINDEGRVILTIDEFTNSTLAEVEEEGDGYEGYEEGYYCYPNVKGHESMDRIYESDEDDKVIYEVYYYHETMGGFMVYLDSNFKVINKPEDKYSKLLGKDLSFSSYVPSMDLMLAYDSEYNQYVFNLNQGTKVKQPEYYRIVDFYPSYYTAYWKDALIYYPDGFGKALMGDKVDFSQYNASKSHSEGISLYYQSDYNSAINKFREALKIFPNYADAYFQLGLCYSSLNNSFEAQKNYKEAIGLDPRNSYYIETLYEVLSGRSEWDAMLSTARTALASGKEENAVDYFYLGLAYQSKQMCNDAINAYTRALELDHYMAEAYHNRGLCHMTVRKYETAIKDITTAISNCKYCDSDELGLYNQNLGDAYNSNGDKVLACKFWQKAYKFNSRYNRYLYSGCK